MRIAVLLATAKRLKRNETQFIWHYDNLPRESESDWIDQLAYLQVYLRKIEELRENNLRTAYTDTTEADCISFGFSAGLTNRL